MYAYVKVQTGKDLCFWDSDRSVKMGAKFGSCCTRATGSANPPVPRCLCNGPFAAAHVLWLPFIFCTFAFTGSFLYVLYLA